MGRGHGAKPESVRQKFVEVMANPNYKSNKARIAELQINETTFYEWLKDPELMKQVEDRIAKYTDAELSTIYGALIDRAKTGDVQAVKLYMELKDKYISRTEQNADININIKVEE